MSVVGPPLLYASLYYHGNWEGGGWVAGEVCKWRAVSWEKSARCVLAADGAAGLQAGGSLSAPAPTQSQYPPRSTLLSS